MMRTFAFAFDGQAREISADPRTRRLFLWDGQEITGMSGEEVAALIRLKGHFEAVERHKARPPQGVGVWLRRLREGVL